MQFTPRPYQREASDFIQANKCAGLFLDPGLGKTATTLDAIIALQDAGEVDRVLILAPLRVVHGVWRQEAAKWAQFRDLYIEVLHGAGKDKAFKADADIYLMNFDGIPWLRRKFDELGALPFDMLVVDESTAFKDTSTQRFRKFKKLVDCFERRVILTGTPAPNSLLDLYGQIWLLDKGQSLGRTITIHRNTYWRQDFANPYKLLPQDGAKQAITEQTAHLVKRMSEDMYLQLPELVTQDVAVQLPPKVRDVYDQIERDFFAELDAGEILAENAAIATGKLRQLAGGGMYYEPDADPGGRAVQHFHDEKTDAVADLVAQCDGPVMVLYEYGHELDRLRARFPDAPVISGGIKDAELVSVCERWNSGGVPVLLVQPQSASHGLNLQGGGRHMVWHTVTWSGERYQQMIKRLHRSGQKDTVIVHRVVAADTIDTAVINAISDKAAGQAEYLTALHNYRAARGL